MHVKIESEKHGRGKVWVDGQEVKSIASLRMKVGELNTVTLELLADSVEVELKEAIVEEKREPDEQRQ